MMVSGTPDKGEQQMFERMGIGLLALAAITLSVPGSAAGATAGIFQFVAGDVRILPDAGSEREARKGALLSVGDTVATSKGATAQIKMGDGAIVVVQPQSRVTVVVFHYSGSEDGSERVVYRLEQGGFRAVTGAIGHTHKNNYLIETPVAHMGVRGTDHESYYFAPGGSERPGAYNKVNTGLTFIRTQAGEVVVAPNQVGYVASGREVPSLLPMVPDFFNRAVAPRSARLSSPERGPGTPPVVQDVMATNGTNLSNPPSEMPGEGSVAGYVEKTGTVLGQSAFNPAIAPTGAKLVNAGGDSAWGVDWGSWQGGATTVDGKTATGSVHFAHSTNLTTASQLGALSAGGVSATYNYLGGPAPTNEAGTAGKIDSLSVGVNFATQRITSYAVAATVDSKSWSASGSGTFSQFSGSSGVQLKGTCTGCAATAANGNANGAFVGSAAEKMITSFGLKAGNTQAISGVGYLGR